jgi:Uma2 family endonuclease
MAVEPTRRVTIEEYLAFERGSPTKNEFVDGEIFAMTGASRRHNLLTVNVASSLHAQLRGRSCELYSGDMRVRVPATNLFTYPDVTIVCGEPVFDDRESDTLLNPTLIVEVLSPSTEGYDRGRKFAHYRTVASLREYVLVSQEEVRLERFSCQEDGSWLLTEAAGLEEVLPLPSTGCELRLADVYERVLAPAG